MSTVDKHPTKQLAVARAALPQSFRAMLTVTACGSSQNCGSGKNRGGGTGRRAKRLIFQGHQEKKIKNVPSTIDTSCYSMPR